MIGKSRRSVKQLALKLADRFDAPPAFVEEYLTVTFGPKIDISSMEGWLSGLSPTQHLHTTYALSTNQRALDVVAVVRPRLRKSIGRHLDIGCGYGGLLKAFSSDTTKSIGIEINKQLAKYSQLNTADRDMKIINDSFESVDIDQLGEFDLITCTEVIEHVSNPEKMVESIGKLLSKNGLLFLRMPNGRSIDFVRSDGHFLMFGICLLSREEAKAYKHAMTGVDDDYEHMGEYYTYPFYEACLTRAELQSTLISSDVEHADLTKTAAEKCRALAGAYEEWLGEAGSLPYFMRQQIIVRLAEYLRDFHAAHLATMTGRPVYKTNFSRDYLTDFWTIIGIRQ